MDHYAFVVYVMFCGPRLPGKIRRFPTLSCAEEWVSGQSFVTMFGSWAPSLCKAFSETEYPSMPQRPWENSVA